MFEVEKLERRQTTIKWHDVVDGSDAKKKKHICIDSKESFNLDSLSRSQDVQSVWLSRVLTEEIAAIVNSFPRLEYLLGMGNKIQSSIKNKVVEYVTLDRSPAVKNFGVIEGCKNIKYLLVSSCIQISSLNGVDCLANLKEFELTGAPRSMGTVDTLEPLTSCKKLEYLSLATRVKDKSLRPLVGLPKLKHLWLPNRFHKDEYIYLLENSKSLKQIELHNGTFDLENGFVKDDD